jgi:hypothetical protein
MSLRTIHKYRLQIREGVQQVDTALGGDLLSVQTQHGEPMLWVQIRKGATQVSRYVQMFKTGQPIPDHVVLLRHLGTLQLYSDMVVYHVYEVGA